MVRYAAIDSFRFIAAVGVVLLHFALYTGSAPLNTAIEKSYLFVDLFFCISGFVLFETYSAERGVKFGYFSFLKRRLARVYPLHLVTFAFYLTIAFAFWHDGLAVDSGVKYDATAIVPNLLLVHAWGTTKELSFNYPSWSISAEWFVYLCFPLVLWLARRGGATLLFSAALVVVLALEVLHQLGVLPPWTTLSYDFGAARAVPSFLAGAALARLVESGRWRLRSFAAAGLCFGAAVAAMIAHFDDRLVVVLLIATVATATAAEASGARGFLTHPLMAKLGTWSYSLYMMHPVVATLFIAEIGRKDLGITGGLASIAWCLVALVLAIGLAGLVHTTFEVPARRVLRDWRWPARRASAPGRADTGIVQPAEASLAPSSPLATVEQVTVGGLPVARLDLQATAELMVDLVAHHKLHDRPYYFTSTNGEVTARCRTDPHMRSLVCAADLISADGQPLVFASRLFCRAPLPERVATTDIFDIVAERAEHEGVSFYLLGATEEANVRTYERARRKFPKLRIVGRCHGFLRGAALEQKIDEINQLSPGILWLAMGVPREQTFVVEWMHRLANVGMVKTSGGLFDFLSGRARRAPKWMQTLGVEWAHRVWCDPRRLLWRYVVTNPVAVLAMILQSN